MKTWGFGSNVIMGLQEMDPTLVNVVPMEFGIHLFRNVCQVIRVFFPIPKNLH